MVETVQGSTATIQKQQLSKAPKISNGGIANSAPKIENNSPNASSADTKEIHSANKTHSSGKLELLMQMKQVQEAYFAGIDSEARRPDLIKLLDTTKEAIQNQETINESKDAIIQELDQLQDFLNKANEVKSEQINSSFTKIVTLIENDGETGAVKYTPRRNLQGAGFATIVDTFFQNSLGNIIGPGIVRGTEKLGDPLVDKLNLGALAEHAKVLVGLTGFMTAEGAINGWGILQGKGFDHLATGINDKITNFVDNKIPNFKENFNAGFDKVMSTVTHSILSIFGAKKKAEAGNGDALPKDFVKKIADYIKDRPEIDSHGSKHRDKLIMEMLDHQFANQYDGEIPKPLKAFMGLVVNNYLNGNNHHTMHSLVANEAALAIKPWLTSILGKTVGEAAYKVMFYGIPNHYIFVFRPIANLAMNTFERHAADIANAFKLDYKEANFADAH